MYTGCGHRSQTQQHVTLGATKEGKLTLINHIGTSLTSLFDDFVEPVGAATIMMYACPNLEIKYRLARINADTPIFMRGPGEAPGMFALESAMDELASALNIDPIEQRLRNHADIPNMEVQFIEEHDPYVNALRTKSLGELPIVGVAAAISNAVYHATGKRIRDLPITPDKLL
ncbi:MAG: molybdopterin cofactor-binding domain-containing protein [Nostoc sp.]